MATILQRNLFCWKNLTASSDLDRLRFVLNAIPDEPLMQKLETLRGHGRNDYPVRAIWNSLLAGVVFEHRSIESLRRELSRNGELRELCGFNPLNGDAMIPSKDGYTHFLKNLFKHEKDILKIFNNLVAELGDLLPDFGEKLAIDSKAIESFSKKQGKKKPDGRRDMDADWGKKEYRGERENGTLWTKVKSWFGYKLHLLVDTTYELPIAYRLTKASASDYNNLLPLIEKASIRHPELIKNAKECTADRGYDSLKNNRKLFDEFKIKPIIDIRNMWRVGDGNDKTRLLFPQCADNIVYDYKGTMYCICPETSEKREMAFCGFEKGRRCLKYRCPAAAYGFKCSGGKECGNIKSDYGRIVRVPLDIDRRVFTPIARSSNAWNRKYKKRTAVERVNSRLDVSFGFELHTIRGMAKMKLRVGIALIVMLAMAAGSLNSGQKERMRSLIKKVA